MKNIVWFHEVRKNDIPLVGGKGANLGELASANFPVPSGFIITAKAYFKFIEETGIKKTILEKINSLNVDDTEQLKKVSAEIRELIKKTPMSDDLKREIIAEYLKLGKHRIAWLTSSEQAYVAVRSSATAEDLPEASFAGQQETYLNVHGCQELLKAVKNCWASLFTARAIFYRKKKNFATEKVGIAVIVQNMVDSDKSGVMFTADPTGDTTKMVIEACFGLGEAIVSGSITPDTYVVDKNTLKIIDKKIGYQKWMLKKDGEKTRKIKLLPNKGAKQKITDDKIIELAKIGRQIEAHYKAPQDIEWAIEGSEIKILQSRAITTLSLKDKLQSELKRRAELEKVENEILLDGLAASPGIVTGEVVVVPNISQIGKVKEGQILVTKMTNPDWVPIMKKSAAIVTDEGGTTCHAAIVSRELGIPCVVGTENATKILKDGMKVTVDGYKGNVYKGEVHLSIPEKTTDKIIKLQEIDEIEEAIKLELKSEEEERFKVLCKEEVYSRPKAGLKGIAEQLKEREKVAREIEEEKSSIVEIKERINKIKELLKRSEEERSKIKEHKEEAKEIIEKFGYLKAESMSEKEIKEEEHMILNLLAELAPKVKVNVALPEAAERAAQTGADGVGLLRAEHMITASGVHPAEYLRRNEFDKLVKVVHDGIEKVVSKFKGKPVWYRTFDARTDEFRNLEGGKYEPHEDNPMLGWHGIRRDLDQKELLKAQFLAIKQLLDEGYSNIGIMLPFVHTAEQVREAKKIAEEVGLKREKGVLEFGVMIEVPSAALTIEDIIAEGIDFISFGTNDLTQLTLGIDRNNERIQKYFNEMHPSVLKLIKMVIEACKKAGVKTSICGQAASNPEMVRILVQYGIDSVSANIDSVKKIKAVVIEEEKRLLIESTKYIKELLQAEKWL
ncbi:MAG: aldolase/citrate lyase family protein [Candidatus Diapherotrites archaeon]